VSSRARRRALSYQRHGESSAEGPQAWLFICLFFIPHADKESEWIEHYCTCHQPPTGDRACLHGSAMMSWRPWMHSRGKAALRRRFRSAAVNLCIQMARIWPCKPISVVVGLVSAGRWQGSSLALWERSRGPMWLEEGAGEAWHMYSTRSASFRLPCPGKDLH
jgi:hypothetical protein